MNFGWVQSPTAVMAWEPKLPTIMVSTMPTKAIKKDSTIEGQAIETELRINSLCGGISPSGSLPRSARLTFTSCTPSSPFCCQLIYRSRSAKRLRRRSASSRVACSRAKWSRIR